MKCVLMFAAVLVTLVYLLAPSLPSYRMGGTFIGAVVAQDGIVVAADSRTTFLDATGKSFGYLDGTQKIYAAESTAVAVSGLTSVQGELFNSFVERNSFLLARPVDEALYGFSVWLPFQNSTNVLLISAGFNHAVPTICARSVVSPQECQTSGFVTNRPAPSLKSWLSALRSAPKVADAAGALKQAIAEAAAMDRSIGGPISIVQLPPAAPAKWLENPPHPVSWKSVCDLIRDYRVGRVRLEATVAREEFDRHIETTCPR
jgi:hypothetical protein